MRGCICTVISPVLLLVHAISFAVPHRIAQRKLLHFPHIMIDKSCGFRLLFLSGRLLFSLIFRSIGGCHSCSLLLDGPSGLVGAGGVYTL